MHYTSFFCVFSRAPAPPAPRTQGSYLFGAESEDWLPKPEQAQGFLPKDLGARRGMKSSNLDSGKEGTEPWVSRVPH